VGAVNRARGRSITPPGGAEQALTAGAVMAELVLQSIPIVFSTRRSLEATFA
jgi:hypothetical protein